MTRLFAIVRSPSRRRWSRDDEARSSQRIDAALDDRRLRTLPPEIEERFQLDTADNQVRGLFRAALAAALVYNVQLVAEYSLTPDVFSLAAALHFGFITPALLLVAAFARSAVTPLRRDVMSFAIPALVAAQVTVIYFASESEGARSYAGLLAVIAILCNASLPFSSRCSVWATGLCLGLLAVIARAPHRSPGDMHVGGLIPISLCAMLTLFSAFQRNRETRRAYLFDQRQRLRMAEVGQEARHDPMTGLANRRRLEEAAKKMWENPSALVSPISVVLFDVDHFKAFNDRYGHQAGDECLRRIAACALEEIAAEDDVAARYGGEEFILLLPRTELEEARRVAERLRAAVVALRIPHAGSGEIGFVTASMGVACADSAWRGFEDLTADADAALYRAKRSGRNRVIAATMASPKGPRAA